MSALKKFDIFAKEFTFTTLKESRYVTYPGAFFSLLLMGLIAVTIFYFGTDFYNRKNPTVNFQNVIGNTYSKEQLLNKNFLLPWAIIDSANNIVNLTKIIYPSATYLSYNRFKNGSYGLLEQVNLTWDVCSKLNNSYITGSMSNFNCFNLEGLNITFGGSWDTDFVQYFMINFFYCENLDTYSLDGNCTSFSDLSSFLNNNYPYFSIYYPSLHFMSDSVSNPLQLEYINYYTQLNLGITKRDYFYFQKNYLNDDQGWLISENKTSIKYSISNRKTDYNLFPVSEYNSTSTNSIIYSCVFYMDKNYGLYTRIYMKIQNLAAIVGGVVNLIQIMFSIIYSFINIYLRDITLINEIFDFDNQKKTGSQPKQRVSSFLAINFKKNSTQTIVVSRPLHNQMIRESEPKISLTERHLNNTDKKLNMEDSISNIALKKIPNLEREIKINPGFFLSCKDCICCSSCNDDEENKTLGIFNISREFVSERLDVAYYLKTLEVIEKLKLIVLNYYQNISLDYINKPDLSVKENVEVINSINNPDRKLQIRQIIDYYIDKNKSRTMSDIDKKIFEYIDLDIKSIVDSGESERLITQKY